MILRLTECLAGVEVTLTHDQSGQVWVEKTDVFGDYWFKKMSAGLYSLQFYKEGYQPLMKTGITVKESMKIEDIALVQAK
jgi:hypothetical protein